MTTIVFETDAEEVGKIKKVLKALGVKNIWVQEDETKLTKEEFFAKIDKSIAQAKEGKKRIVSKENQKEFMGI